VTSAVMTALGFLCAAALALLCIVPIADARVVAPQAAVSRVRKPTVFPRGLSVISLDWNIVKGTAARVSLGSRRLRMAVLADNTAVRWANESWVPEGGAGVVSASCGVEGSKWLLNADGVALRWNGPKESYEEVKDVPKIALLAAGQSNIAAAYEFNNGRGTVYLYNTTGWGRLSRVQPLSDLAIGSDASLWAVSSRGQALEYSGNRWGSRPCRYPLRNIAVADSGHVFALTTDGNLVRYQGGKWVAILGGPISHVAAASDGTLLAVRQSGVLVMANVRSKTSRT